MAVLLEQSAKAITVEQEKKEQVVMEYGQHKIEASARIKKLELDQHNTVKELKVKPIPSPSSSFTMRDCMEREGMPAVSHMCV